MRPLSTTKRAPCIHVAFEISWTQVMPSALDQASLVTSERNGDGDPPSTHSRLLNTSAVWPARPLHGACAASRRHVTPSPVDQISLIQSAPFSESPMSPPSI